MMPAWVAQMAEAMIRLSEEVRSVLCAIIRFSQIHEKTSWPVRFQRLIDSQSKTGRYHGRCSAGPC